ncbi:MAG TPA: carboxypeptidase-like regulatory domain-containing protein [Kofleriaceae bacterium]
MKTVSLVALAVSMAACAHGGRAYPRASDGAITGLVRDYTTGDPIAMADIQLISAAASKAAPVRTHSDKKGNYDLAHVKPGRYELTAQFAGQPLRVKNIEVKAGGSAYVDLTFTLGSPDLVEWDWNDPRRAEINRYQPKDLAPNAARIEGTVNDTGTHERVAGAVVTAVMPDTEKTEQTVSDDQGRYQFENVTPGMYTVSAYYSISGHGQIEVQRNSIPVAAEEAVVVPLWVELTK